MPPPESDSLTHRIVKAEAFALALPPTYRGMAGFYLVRLEAEDGCVGWGEAGWIPFKSATAVKLLRETAESIIGSAPSPGPMVRQMSQSDLVQHPESTRGACISAVEMACWDLMGHQLGQPIHVMLGGAHRQRLRGYTYLHETPAQVAEGITRSQIWADPKLAAESARRTVGSGWSAIKLDPIGFPPGRRLPFDPSAAEIDQVRRVLAAVREAVGPRVDIMLGTHGQFTVSGAIRVARAVEEFDPAWFEEPIPPEDPALMARVAEATTIPIAAGERLVSIHDFAALLRVSGASILNIHTGRCGGILEARKIAILAEAAHASIAPHLWAGELVAASAIQVGAASPNFMIQECIGDFSGNYASGILKEPIRVENGYIHLPEGPGLGVEIREDVVRQLSVNC